MKVLYTEKYKIPMKESAESQINGKDIWLSQIGRLNIVKMPIPPKAIYRFNDIPFKFLMACFTELEQKNSKFIWNHKISQIAKMS